MATPIKTRSSSPDGNHFFTFISEMFMANLKTKLISAGPMTRFWKGYVDSICTIIGKDEVKGTLDLLNGLHLNIACFLEKETRSIIISNRS